MAKQIKNLKRTRRESQVRIKCEKFLKRSIGERVIEL